jgi:hypothetical protein
VGGGGNLTPAVLGLAWSEGQFDPCRARPGLASKKIKAAIALLVFGLKNREKKGVICDFLIEIQSKIKKKMK